jgi:hypothetical protein
MVRHLSELPAFSGSKIKSCFRHPFTSHIASRFWEASVQNRALRLVPRDVPHQFESSDLAIVSKLVASLLSTPKMYRGARATRVNLRTLYPPKQAGKSDLRNRNGSEVIGEKHHFQAQQEKPMQPMVILRSFIRTFLIALLRTPLSPILFNVKMCECR